MISTAVEPLTAKERADLVQLESVIEKGLSAFRSISLALAEISRRALWREQADTFEAYCHARLGINKRQGGDLVTAGCTIELLEAAGLPAPENMSQARNVNRVLKISRRQGRPPRNGTNGDGAPAMPAAERFEKLKELLEASPASGRTNGYADLNRLHEENHRPGPNAKERKVRTHLDILRRITSQHPWAERGLQLLAAYEASAFPWRELP